MIRQLKIPRHDLAERDPTVRVRDFDETDRGFTPAAAILEAGRCVQCAQPPCAVLGCPLSNHIPLWLDHLVNGRFQKAAQVIARTSNLPEACGKLCPHEALCESRCVVAQVSRPVSIGRLEEFVTRLAREKGWYRTTPARPPTGRKVAVIGAGPAGLAAAEELLDYGHAVTVFDKHPRPGGLLAFGIPRFKYANQRLDGLIQRLIAKGALFRCGLQVGRDLTLDHLVEVHGFDAVLLAVGAEKARRTNLPGEHLKNIHLATDFLVCANPPPEDLPPHAGPPLEVGRVCAVIGGGDTAMDCLRTAVRLGFQDVRCLYRRGEKEMPGRAEDKQHALEEGVRFDYFVAPVEFLGTDRIQAVRCLRTRPSEPDDTGRPRPVPIPGSEFEVPVDTLVLALGFDVRDEPARSAGLTLRRGRIPVDANLATTRPGLFAAGDAHHGPDLIVTAVNDARRAAAAIDQYLQQRPKPGTPT